MTFEIKNPNYSRDALEEIAAAVVNHSAAIFESEAMKPQSKDFEKEIFR